jgi:hypothetical protein
MRRGTQSTHEFAEETVLRTVCVVLVEFARVVLASEVARTLLAQVHPEAVLVRHAHIGSEQHDSSVRVCSGSGQRAVIGRELGPPQVDARRPRGDDPVRVQRMGCFEGGRLPPIPCERDGSVGERGVREPLCDVLVVGSLEQSVFLVLTRHDEAGLDQRAVVGDLPRDGGEAVVVEEAGAQPPSV